MEPLDLKAADVAAEDLTALAVCVAAASLAKAFGDRTVLGASHAMVNQQCGTTRERTCCRDSLGNVRKHPLQAMIVRNRPDNEEWLALATGRYLGEGFDVAALDPMFLTMPTLWKGTRTQHTSRLRRKHHAKREVIAYD